MRRLIRSLPVGVEAFIIILGAFGIFLFSSVMVLINPALAPQVSEQGLRSLLAYEPIALLVLGAFLWLRDWTPAKLGLKLHSGDAFIGMGITAATYAAVLLLSVLFSLFNYQPAYLDGTTEIVKADLALTTVVGATVVNALFEELFVCGYLVAVAKEHSRLVAGINISVGLRLAYHLYQGSAAVIGIIPFGLLCAWWFGRTGRLWPLIIAHTIIDLIGLSGHIKG